MAELEMTTHASGHELQVAQRVDRRGVGLVEAGDIANETAGFCSLEKQERTAAELGDVRGHYSAHDGDDLALAFDTQVEDLWGQWRFGRGQPRAPFIVFWKEDPSGTGK
jgi:hypothetical protein